MKPRVSVRDVAADGVQGRRFPVRKLPREVRDLADLLEQGKYTQALLVCDDLLERNPSNGICRAMRAVALDRCGRRQEALSICNLLQASKAVDLHVVEQIEVVYRRAGMYSEITSAYAAAFEESPKNLNIGLSYLFSLAVDANLSRQQQVSLQLYWEHGMTQHLFLAVSSILLQAHGIGPSRPLELAEMLLQRAPIKLSDLDKQTVSANDAFCVLLLHIATARQQGKHENALQMINEQQGNVSNDHELDDLRVHLLTEFTDALGAEQEGQDSDDPDGPVIDDEVGFWPDPTANRKFTSNKALNEAVNVAKCKFARQENDWQAARQYIAICFRAMGYLQVACTSQSLTAEIEEVKVSKRSLMMGTTSRTTVDKSAAVDSLQIDFVDRTDGAAAKTFLDSALDKTQKFKRHQETEEALDAGNVSPASSESAADAAAHPIRDAFVMFKERQVAGGKGSCVSWLGELELRAMSFACSELESIQHRPPCVDASDYRGWPLPYLQKDVKDYVERLVAYFARRGHSGGCYAEMKPFVCLLDDRNTRTFLTRAKRVVEERAEHSADKDVPLPSEDRHFILCFARLRWGLRALPLESATLEKQVAEVDGLLFKWYSFSGLAKQKSENLQKQCAHQTTTEARKGAFPISNKEVEVDEWLCLAVVHLFELDRMQCTQHAKTASTVGGSHNLLSVRDRIYMLDALTLLEVGIKNSPYNARIQLLLSVAYGAIGATSTMRRMYSTLGLAKEPVWGAPTSTVLELLLLHGPADPALNMCRRIRRSQESLQTMLRTQVGNLCDASGGKGFNRTREYLVSLEKLKHSPLESRLAVEEVFGEYFNSPDTQKRIDCLKMRATILAEIAKRPTEKWIEQEVQDNTALQHLAVLPKCTPLQALFHGSIGSPHILWPDRSLPRAPSRWSSVFQTPKSGAVHSVATGLPDRRKILNITGLPSLSDPERSGLEEILTPTQGISAGLMKMRAILLLLAHEMLQDNPSSQHDMPRLLHEFQGALAAEGLATNCNPSVAMKNPAQPTTGQSCSTGGANSVSKTQNSVLQEGEISSILKTDNFDENAEKGKFVRAFGANQTNGPPVDDGVANMISLTTPVEDNKACFPPPWRPKLATSDDLFWRCTLLACDLAHRVLQACVAQNEKVHTEKSTKYSVAEASETISGRKASCTFEPPIDGKKDTGSPRQPRQNALVSAALKTMRPVSSTPHGPPSSAGSCADVEQHSVAMDELLWGGKKQAAWEGVRRGLSVLRILIRDCANSVLAEPRPGNGPSPLQQTENGPPLKTSGEGIDPNLAMAAAAVGVEVDAASALGSGDLFRFGGNGIRALRAFLSGPVFVVVPMFRLATTRFNALATGESSSRLPLVQQLNVRRNLDHSPLAFQPWETARLALAEAAEEMQLALKEIYQSLVGAQWDTFDHQIAGPSTSQVARLRFFEEHAGNSEYFEEARRSVEDTMAKSHRKQLASIEEALRGQMLMLKELHIKTPSSLLHGV